MNPKPALRQNIFLIGDTNPLIEGNKLPTRRQVLKLLFFNLRNLNSTVRGGASQVIKEVLVFWERARIPTQYSLHCTDKLVNLHQEWRNIQRNAGQLFNKQNEDDFSSKLDDLFDVAHANVLQMIDESRRDFLLDQRRNRHNRITDVLQAEANIQLRKEDIAAQRLKKSETQKEVLEKVVELASSDEGSFQTLRQNSIGTYSNVAIEDLAVPDLVIDQHEAGPSVPKKSRGTVNVIDEKLVAALDRCRISDRDAVHLIAAVAQSLSYDLDSLIINRTSIRRYREKLREAKAANVKKVFKDTVLNAVVLHWDGKLLPDLLKRELVDRLPVLITSGNDEKLLGVPALDNGTGISQAQAIHEVLEDWGLSHTVKALCCDTTASNLGHINGAAGLLEQRLEKDILFLPCRHHIFELVLKSVFDKKMPASSGPNVPIFKRFKESWIQLDQAQYKSGIENEDIARVLTDYIENINSFVEEMLQNIQPREDYRELLELTQIFIEIVPSRGIKFRFPGAYHHARWMSKAIYCLKIYLFRETFKLTAKEEKAISQICIFIVTIHVRAWFTAPLATQAPNHDLQFLKKLNDYKLIDPQVSQVTLQKFKNHLWYLNPETAAMTFFDMELPVRIKQKMLLDLNIAEENNDDIPKRININLKDIDNLCGKEIDHFITAQSIHFFDRFEINKEFLSTDPSLWIQDDRFVAGLRRVKNLKIVNDTAERAVCLMEKYNDILTRDEDQKQFILQVVSEYKKKFPDSRKQTVVQNF